MPNPQAESVHPLDDAHIAIGSVSQCAQRLLVPRTVMRGDGLLEARKLNENRTLSNAIFIGAPRHATREEAAACGLERRPRELGIRSECHFVTYRTVG